MDDMTRIMDLTMANDFRVRQVNGKVNKLKVQTFFTVVILGAVIGYGAAEVVRLKKEIKELKEN